MRQINFVVIFVICLALVLFGIENTTPSTIHVVPGVELSAPLSVELLIAAGVGAVLAWIFSVWTGLTVRLAVQPQVSKRDVRIQELEQDVERYKVELEEQQRLLPASKPQDVEVTEVV